GGGALEEGGEAVGLAVAVGVFEDADAVVLGAAVVGRGEMRVALDDQQPALGVEVDADRVDDVRGGGEQFHFEAVVVDAGNVRLIGRGRGGRQEQDGKQRTGEDAFDHRESSRGQ